MVSDPARWREPEETKLAEQPGPFLWVNAIRGAPFCWLAASQVHDPIQLYDWGAHNDMQGTRHVSEAECRNALYRLSQQKIVFFG